MTIDDLEGWIGKTSEEISAPSVECPAPKQWSMWDGMGTEVEVLQFLYALVCMLKPVRIIETGTYLGYGYGTAHLALGAKHNGFGYLNSAEPIKDLADKAMQRITSLGLDDYVDVWLGNGVQLIGAQEVVDFAFVDSDCDTRIEEMQVLLPRLHEGSMVAVHDTSVFHMTHNNGPEGPSLSSQRITAWR